MAYEIIQFVNKVGASSRQKGFKITDELVVGYSSVYGSRDDDRWKVYSISSGRPVVDLTLRSMEDAVEFAKWIDKLYGEYLTLLVEYPRMDIPQVCMWTVKDGIRTFVALTTLQDRDTISIGDIHRAYEAAQGAEYEYTKTKINRRNNPKY